MDTNKKQLLHYVGGTPVYSSEFEENKFPFETVFPKAITDLIRELHEKSGYPVEFSSGSLLVAFATAIGSTTQLKFKDNFIVRANLYCMLCGAPGTSKTHPIEFMFDPIKGREAMYHKEYKEKLEEYNTFEKKSKKEKETLPSVTKPKLKVYTLNDFTLESLMKNLSESPRGLGIIVDELNSFFDNMNRYNSGSDSEAYNSLWSGVSRTVNRVTTDSFYVPATAVSIFGSIQPDILNNVFSKGKDKNGLAARFLFIMPENLLPLKWKFEDVDKDLIKQYHQAIQKLLDVELQVDEKGEPVPTIIKFTDEAFNRILTWHNGDEFYGKIIEDKGHTYFEAFVKLDNYALRFALILQMIYAAIDNESRDEVGIRAVENAILLVKYFMNEVIKVHKLVYAKDIRLCMSEKQREVYEVLYPEFYLRQAYDRVAELGFTKDQLKKFVRLPKYFTRIAHGKYRKNFFEFPED